MPDTEFGIPMEDNELDAFGGSYDDMPDRQLQNFEGVISKITPERSTQFTDAKTGLGVAQLHIQTLPLNLEGEQKERHQWYSGETKVGSLGQLKAGLAGCGIPWGRTSDMVREVLPGMVFHWVEKETGRARNNQPAPTRLIPVQYLGYDPRTRAELGLELPAGAATYDRMAGLAAVATTAPASRPRATSTPVSAPVETPAPTANGNSNLSEDELLDLIVEAVDGKTVVVFLQSVPAEVRAKPALMAKVRNKKIFAELEEAGRIYEENGVYHIAE